MTMASAAPALETRNLTRRFGGLTAVDNVTMRLASGRQCHHRPQRRR